VKKLGGGLISKIEGFLNVEFNFGVTGDEKSIYIFSVKIKTF
jgi:hypothetical protein